MEGTSGFGDPCPSAVPLQKGPFAGRTREALAATAGPNFHLEPGFGWVLLVLILAVVLQLFFALNVTRARIRFGVQPPDVYAIKGVTGRGGTFSDDAADSTLLRLSAKECDVFNCYQRAHQHSVEMYTIFIPMLLTGGLGFPLTSALGGLVFLLGTFVYALGYYTGEATNRRWGAFQVVGLVICLITTFLEALRLIWLG
ncbi:microsomal glutathione S-transferase 3 [Cyclospora cayetanensis]|uniref:Microsomal glutathione S-transferase 3 n=1 Tax=Cyclospora cayetanensis TaxID=88456 RepID=A0A6P6RSB7_9EIME|nr:microsomal glutathione S-transferase 3 [Cyclospora cayetanensis]